MEVLLVSLGLIISYCVLLKANVEWVNFIGYVALIQIRLTIAVELRVTHLIQVEENPV